MVIIVGKYFDTVMDGNINTKFCRLANNDQREQVTFGIFCCGSDIELFFIVSTFAINDNLEKLCIYYNYTSFFKPTAIFTNNE
ncbi:hypothetical protein MFLAVUS_007734 [Mucor flavus]|uniref:Uncharacterized protein n=1 Tax=Mucor flavus TaxID=439312 RepID=A0ABP9Z551_9FUNG